MTINTQLSDLVVDEQAKVVAKLLHNGFIDFFDGTQPRDAEDGLVDHVFLGSTRFTGFTEPARGVLHALPITDGIVIEDGVCTWARLYRADHKTAVMDVSVGETDANIILRSTKFERGAIIECIAYEHTIAKSTPGV